MAVKTGFPVLRDGAYSIDAKIGSGGSGVVYRAWHARLQKYVVLKRIYNNSKLALSGRARRETDILKNLKHAHLPQLYDFLDEPSGIYTVMEFIPGHSFADLLKKNRKFTQAQVTRWADQLSEVLEYLHGQSPPVLHSDIKPGNIMLTERGDICLIDFNISLVMDGGDAEILGLSHGYASPEQYGPQELPGYYSGSETNITCIETDVSLDAAPPQSQSPSEQRREMICLDARSDIYSLGATLYHLVAGEKPAISTGEIKPLTEFGVSLSDAFICIISRCMERDPSKRFQTSKELHTAVAGIQRR